MVLEWIGGEILRPSPIRRHSLRVVDMAVWSMLTGSQVRQKYVGKWINHAASPRPSRHHSASNLSSHEFHSQTESSMILPCAQRIAHKTLNNSPTHTHRPIWSSRAHSFPFLFVFWMPVCARASATAVSIPNTNMSFACIFCVRLFFVSNIFFDQKDIVLKHLTFYVSLWPAFGVSVCVPCACDNNARAFF